MTDYPTDNECVDDRGDGECRGAPTWRAVPGGTATLRCAHHFEARLERWESSIERYADTPIPPAWFDPTLAGERWNPDD